MDRKRGRENCKQQTPREETVQGKRGRFETGKRNKEEWQTIKKLNKNQEVRQTYCHSSTPTEHTHLSQSNFYTNPINQTQTQSSLTLMRLTNPSASRPASLPAPQRETAVTSLRGKWEIPQFAIAAAAAPLLRESFLVDAAGLHLAPWLKCSSTVALVFSNSHCWVGEDGSHVFMKTRRSFKLLSIQLLLTGWYRLLSWREKQERWRAASKRNSLEAHLKHGQCLKQWLPDSYCSKCSTFSCLVCFMSARGDISTVQTFCLWGTANENNLGLRVEDRNYNGLFVVEDKDCTKTQLRLNSDSCKDILIESNNEYTELGMGITGPL